MRLIDAMKYRKELEEEKRFHAECGNREIVQGIEIAIADLGDIPTTEARPVVHARWTMDNFKHQYCCSNCSAVQPYDTLDDFIDPNNPMYDYWDCDYCPRCGAVMDLESEDTK